MLVLKLVQCSLGLRDCDDRDSYLNKRIDSTGVLLGALFRQYYSKMVKEYKTLCNKEYNNGSWKATDNFHSIVNSSIFGYFIFPIDKERGFCSCKLLKLLISSSFHFNLSNCQMPK